MLLLAIGFLAGHATWLTLRTHAFADQERIARESLSTLLFGGDRADAERTLRRLPRGSQIRLLVEIGRNLTGNDLEQVRSLARDLGILDHARRETHSRHWDRRLHGIRLLTLFDAEGETIAALLDDPDDTVRAQAIESIAGHPTPKVIDRLIALLDDRASFCRFAVQDTLLRIGPAAIEPLAHHLEHSVSPGATVALRVALGMPDHRFLEGVVELTRDPSAECREEAARVLASVGGTAPLLVLEALLEDPSGRVRAAAALGLGELQHWPAAAKLAALLRDREFDVRRAAALALDQLGPSGELVLRRALAERDPFAADMARLVLGTAAVQRAH